MQTTERKASQAWVIAAGGLVVLGMAWIVIHFLTQNPDMPVFGMLLFGAGIVCGFVGLILNFVRR